VGNLGSIQVGVPEPDTTLLLPLQLGAALLVLLALRRRVAR
jgi:hypothetical protein